MKKELIGSLILAILICFPSTAYSEDQDISCHISLVENDVYILKSDKDEVEKGMVNYPLISGDIIYSNGNAKCELQFANGTIIRMDKHTELRLSTLQSPSLTTNKKVTTLHLNKGHIYSMNQVYGREIFQIITPTASLKMFKRSTNSIMVNKKGETHLFVVRGKVGILYDGKQKIQKQEIFRAKEGGWIREGQELNRDNKIQNSEFLLWNEKINKNFKELHYGISKIPQVIYRRSPGIVHFAERFSTKFGTWEYHELFGYVWKPADFVFHNRRPFWDANYIKIKGELFLIPNQPWGWTPAHLGTWFWSKSHGWIWIPGDAFSRGICETGLIVWPGDFFNGYGDPLNQSQLINWIQHIYGSISLYKIYRIQGARVWHRAYLQQFKRQPKHKKPSLQNIPVNLREIIKQVNQTSIQKVVRYLQNNQSPSRITIRPVQVNMLRNKINQRYLPDLLKKRIKNRNLTSRTENQLVSFKRDWNPDSIWAGKTGIKIYYSLKRNQVICPKLKLNSRMVTQIQKGHLRRSVIKQNQNWFNRGHRSSDSVSPRPALIIPPASGTKAGNRPNESLNSGTLNSGNSASKTK